MTNAKSNTVQDDE